MNYTVFTAALDAEVFVRLTMAFLLGGAIGVERQLHGRPAGLRTNMLVCVGAAMIMIAAKSHLVFYDSPSPDVRITIDPGRIVAGVMTGIGFLGAGAIIRIGDIIRGLTTAACIWFVAALGIVIGDGLYGLALIATAGVLILLIVLPRVERHLKPLAYPILEVRGPLEKLDVIESNCRRIMEDQKVRIQRRKYDISNEIGQFKLIFHLRLRGPARSRDIIRSLSTIPDIFRVTWH